MLVTIDRPAKFNSLLHIHHWELDRLWTWFENEPSLRVAIITGKGTKAFCAGSHLLEIEAVEKTKHLNPSANKPWEHTHPPSGFAGLSRRKGKKPILAAVNGVALGGGMEITLNWYVSSAHCALDALTGWQ